MIIKADAPQDISGVRFAKSYALSQWQLGAFDFMDLDEWAASGYTSTNRSETRLLGDASNLFHFWCYGNDTVSACEVTESNELKFAITANTGLVLDLKMLAGSGGTVLDYSGSNNNGTLQSGAAWSTQIPFANRIGSTSRVAMSGRVPQSGRIAIT